MKAALDSSLAGETAWTRRPDSGGNDYGHCFILMSVGEGMYRATMEGFLESRSVGRAYQLSQEKRRGLEAAGRVAA